jgi:hypothetical protein
MAPGLSRALGARRSDPLTGVRRNALDERPERRVEWRDQDGRAESVIERAVRKGGRPMIGRTADPLVATARRTWCRRRER